MLNPYRGADRGDHGGFRERETHQLRAGRSAGS